MHLEKVIHKKSYEHPVMILRRHPFVFIPKIAMLFALAILPIIIYELFIGDFSGILQNEAALSLLYIIASAYYLMIWLFIFANFADYYLDTWIVTNDRIVNIEQHGLFGRTVAELDLYKIQDATSEIKGIIPTMFGYGYVYIQTAAEKERFEFEQVSDPHTIRKMILDLVEKDRQFHKI